MATSSTRLSSRGQVVIPAAVRAALGLAEGDVLTVEVENDPPRIVLRRPDLAEVLRRIEDGYSWFVKNDVDLVEQLHESRRQARIRERRGRGR